jgi:hypothetical protein
VWLKGGVGGWYEEEVGRGGGWARGEVWGEGV